jgi:hypothetical protein
MDSEVIPCISLDIRHVEKCLKLWIVMKFMFYVMYLCFTEFELYVK